MNTQILWNRKRLRDVANLDANFCRLSSDCGCHCPVCEAWSGRILSVRGDDDRFPTFEDAVKAGLFHYECTHRIEAVFEDDELLYPDAKTEIEKQAAENVARAEALRAGFTARGVPFSDADCHVGPTAPVFDGEQHWFFLFDCIRLTAILKTDGDEWEGDCPELETCYAVGKTREGVLDQMKTIAEALVRERVR